MPTSVLRNPPFARHRLCTGFLLGIFAIAVTTPAIAQDGSGTVPRGVQAQGGSQQRGVWAYLQNEPMTLFDAGMKSLRRLALDSAEKMRIKTGMTTTAKVSYRDDEGRIDITFDYTVKPGRTVETMRQDCRVIRRETILGMLRIGKTEYGSELSVPERIRRRIGGQFAHEPIRTMNEAVSLGEQLGTRTHFTVNLETDEEQPLRLTCTAPVVDLMLN